MFELDTSCIQDMGRDIFKDSGELKSTSIKRARKLVHKDGDDEHCSNCSIPRMDMQRNCENRECY